MVSYRFLELMDCGLELKKADGPMVVFGGRDGKLGTKVVAVQCLSWKLKMRWNAGGSNKRSKKNYVRVWHLSFILRYLYSICFFSFVSVNALTHSLAVSFWIVSSCTLTWAHLQILQNFYKGVAEKTQELIRSSVPVWEQLRAALAGNHTPLQKLH